MSDLGNYHKLLAGELASGADPVLFEMRAKAAQKKAALDAIDPGDMDARREALRDYLGAAGDFVMILPPFFAEYGTHIRCGDRVFVNTGATFLDANYITFGDRVAVGPNVQFLTATHPVRPEERMFDTPQSDFLPFDVGLIAKPITVGNDCWIGAGSIIMPGVTIGDGTTVGAGSVVTKSLPSRVVAVGNPARVIRSIER